MSYVGERFRHDVFFSYAHGNNLLRDWSRSVAGLIHSTLEILLSDREGVLSFFTDEALLLSQPLTAELREHVQSSAALVIVMTGHYLKSPWCADEGRWFRDIVAREPGDGRGMFFVVRAQPVPDPDWPGFLRDERGVPLPGYPFCDQAPPEALPWGLNHSQIEKQGPAVALLAQQLAVHLKARRAQEQASARLGSPTPASTGAQPRVLLGFAAEDLEEERAATRERLAAGGLLDVVAPDWPEDVDEIRTAAAAAAEGCEGLVQLCGRAAGRWRHDAEGFVGFQIRLFEDTRRRTWLVPAQDFAPERLPAASGYANLIRARTARLAPLPDPAEIRAVIEKDRNRTVDGTGGGDVTAPDEAPICAVFIQSRSEYEASERRLREELGRLQMVSAHVLPFPPLWGMANPHQLSALIDLRRRFAADLDAQLLLLTDKPELLTEDLLDYLREQRGVVGAFRLPAAIVDASPPGVVPSISGRLPMFQLGAPDFGVALGAWLRECASRPRRPGTASPAPPTGVGP